MAVAGCGGGSGGPQGKLLSRVVTQTANGQEERVFQYDAQNRLIADSKLGNGNKIEYAGNDSRPALVTLGAPLPSGSSVAYTQYQYGEDDLLNGTSTKYYQTQPLYSDKTPMNASGYPRSYLNSEDRNIAFGYVSGPFSGNDASTTFNQGSSPPVLVWDGNGNLLREETTVDVFMTSTTTVCEYTYDSKKNPASGMATPLWWFGISPSYLAWDDSDLFLANANNPVSAACSKTINGTADAGSANTTSYSYTYDQDGYPVAVDVTNPATDASGTGTATNYHRTFEYIPAH